MKLAADILCYLAFPLSIVGLVSMYDAMRLRDWPARSVAWSRSTAIYAAAFAVEAVQIVILRWLA